MPNNALGKPRQSGFQVWLSGGRIVKKSLWQQHFFSLLQWKVERQSLACPELYEIATPGLERTSLEAQHNCDEHTPHGGSASFA